MAVKTVEPGFITHQQKDDDTCGNPDTQSENIDEGVIGVTPQVSEGYEYIIPDHCPICLQRLFQTQCHFRKYLLINYL